MNLDSIRIAKTESAVNDYKISLDTFPKKLFIKSFTFRGETFKKQTESCTANYNIISYSLYSINN